MREIVQQRLKHQELQEKANPENDNIHKNDKSEIQSSIKWVNRDGEATAQSRIK